MGMNERNNYDADDTQLYSTLSSNITSSSTSDGLERLQKCAISLQRWFWSNGLLLNPDKTTVNFFGTRARLQRTDTPSTITVANATVEVRDKLCVLGVTLDGGLSLDSHVSDIVKICHFHLSALRHIHPSLTREVTKHDRVLRRSCAYRLLQLITHRGQWKEFGQIAAHTEPSSSHRV